tara:strand:+ start:3020 stop:3382 length:363 start_codon:yes stop_codon:yes gene_type:complete
MEINFKIELIRSQVHQWLVTNGLNTFNSSMPEIEIDEEMDEKVTDNNFGNASFIFDYGDDKYLGVCNYRLKYKELRNGKEISGVIVKYIELCYPVRYRMDFGKCKRVWEEIKDEDEYQGS